MKAAGIAAAALAAAGLWAPAGAAEPAPQRMLDDAEARAYAAVGRLNVAGDRHCTAVLIAEQVALTAAHCLFNMRTGRRAAAADIRFVAGQRRDAYVALRGVVASATLPGYRHAAGGSPTHDAVASDLALVMLDAPIAAGDAAPFAVGPLEEGARGWIVGYGRDRPQAASIRDGCDVLAVERGVARLDCPVTFGVSGAPVFAQGPSGPEVAAVVSAMAEGGVAGGPALAAPVAGAIRALTAALATATLEATRGAP